MIACESLLRLLCTKRTSPAGLTKSVVRVNRKWLADRQTDAFDPERTFLDLDQSR